MASTGRTPWYGDGLRFRCTQCGNCCRIEGYVWVNPQEVAELATWLDLEPEDFAALYLRDVDGHLSLVEKPNHDCIFWDDGCTVYPVRPTQCRTFPFWTENLKSPRAWKAASEDCPGMASEKGRHYPLPEIMELKSGRGETGPARERST